MARRRAAAAEKVSDKRSALFEVAGAFKEFRPAHEVLKVVRAVPTRFIQFDHAVGVGGLPIERFMLTHGPSNEGKTLFTLGLMDSFLASDNFVFDIDAERTTTITWAEDLMGANARHPGFYAERPETYEKTIGSVRKFLNTLANLKAKGRLPKTTSALVVVDSLRKLVPENLMKEILKDDEDKGKKGKITSGNDRGAQLKAKMNAAWMDELIPLLDHAGAAFVAIAREMVDPGADKWAKLAGNDYTVGGGGAIYYDASLSMRIERAAWVQDAYKEGEARNVYGERHRVTIKKTKVAGKDAKVAVGYFHSSNGKLVPAGFDRARDLLDLGQRFGVVKKAGSTYAWRKHRWRGEHGAVKKLSEDTAAMGALDAELREHFATRAPVEHNADGEIE